MTTNIIKYTLKIFIFLIPAKIQALDDMWIIGDRWLKEMFPSLQSINDKAAHERKKPPYICEYFNVFCYYPANDYNPMGGIINALIDILNKREKLPRYLLIAPEQSIIRAAGFEAGFDVVARKLISCLQRNISRSLSSRQDDLMNRKPGAVNPVPTRIIWVKMLDGPHYEFHPDRDHQWITDRRVDFNKILENFLVTTSSGYLHIMEIKHLSVNEHFDNVGNINPKGKIQFWKELDHLMKRFDRSEISLDPVWQQEFEAQEQRNSHRASLNNDTYRHY